MDFHTALKIPWIRDFMTAYIKKQAPNLVKIAEGMDGTFYCKYSTSHGLRFDIISDSEEKSSSWDEATKRMLKTCILFEEHDGNPLIFYVADSNMTTKLSYCDEILYQALCMDKIMKKF